MRPIVFHQVLNIPNLYLLQKSKEVEKYEGVKMSQFLGYVFKFYRFSSLTYKTPEDTCLLDMIFIVYIQGKKFGILDSYKFQ
jgi:hypothetical protein